MNFLNKYEKGLERKILNKSRLRVKFDTNARIYFSKKIEKIIKRKPEYVTQIKNNFDERKGFTVERIGKKTETIVQELLRADEYSLNRFIKLRRELLNNNFTDEDSRSIAACLYSLDSTIRIDDNHIHDYTKKLAENLKKDLENINQEFIDYPGIYFENHFLRWRNSFRKANLVIKRFDKQNYQELLMHYAENFDNLETKEFTHKLFKTTGIGIPITKKHITRAVLREDNLMIYNHKHQDITDLLKQ